MPSCEKCWNDSRGHHRDASYTKLVKERDETGHTCTPEQQAGEGADICPKCNRATVHIYCHVCMNPDCDSQSLPTEKGE